MTEALDKKEGEMWRDFYTTILPRRIKKFNGKKEYRWQEKRERTTGAVY